VHGAIDGGLAEQEEMFDGLNTAAKPVTDADGKDEADIAEFETILLTPPV
jgi:hypothetical protein